MKPYTQALTLILAAPLALASETPLKVDTHKVLTLAVAAVNEQFPELSAAELAVEGSLDFQCWLTQPNERVKALDGEFGPCFAKVNFVLTSRKPNQRYVDREGNCEIDPVLQGLHVGLFPGSAASVGVTQRTDAANDVVDCYAEPGNQSSDAPPQPLADDAYEIETGKMVEAAFAETIKKYADISPDDLELGVPMVQLSCQPKFSAELPTVNDVEFAPCVASVTFSSTSSIIEYRYVDADGKCNIMRGPENIKVQIGGDRIDPECARGSFGVTEEFVVECTEEFDDAERWTNN